MNFAFLASLLFFQLSCGNIKSPSSALLGISGKAPPSASPSPTASPTPCPLPACPAPPVGCNYENPVFSAGCPVSCGTLVCPSPTPNSGSTPAPTATPISPPLSTPSPTPVPSVTPTPPPTAAAINPLFYFRFENASNLGAASVGTSGLNFSYYGTPASAAPNGQVGGYANFIGGLVMGPAALPISTSSTNGIAVEFLLKPGPEFIKKRQDKVFETGGVTVKFSAESIDFVTPGDAFSIPLDGIGPKQLGYYLDGSWHHFVFQFDGTTGKKEIWVDGSLPQGFSKVAPIVASLFTAATPIELGTTTDYDMFRGGLDELAVYQNPLPGSFIVQHEIERVSGKPYTFIHNTSISVPTPPSVLGAFDPLEFAPGTIFPTSATSPAQGVSVSALDQLRKFPTPRFRTGSTLPRNPSYFDWSYLGNLQYNTAAVANQIGGQIMTEMADRWNYYLTQRLDFATPANFSNVNRPEYYLRQVTNARPDLPLWSLTLRVQNTIAQKRQDLPNACYLKDASGVPVLISTKKRIRPFSTAAAASAAGCPDSNYDADATYVMNGFNAALSSSGINTQTVFAGFSDNNEFLYPASTSVLSADSTITPDYQSAGSPGYLQYDTNHFGRLDARFRDLVRASNPRLSNAIYQSYQVDTDQGYYWEWTNFRQSFTSYLGHPLATPDFYPRYPNNWRNGYSAWHGLSWMMKARRYEIDHGDPLYSPYTAAGWDADEGKNIRPAQWLGLQKLIYGIGAPYTFPGYYIEAAPWPKAEAYIHQVAIPIYAQAALSRAEDLLSNGSLMDGDLPMIPTDAVSARKGYEFWGGDPRMKIIVRKSNTANLYLIVGTIQPLSSMIGNAELSKVAEISLAGQRLRFEVRRQGSMYLYDHRNAASPLFYQIDGWHESTHPYYWNQNSVIEAELADSGLSSSAPELVTEPGPLSPIGSYVGARTYVSFPATQNSFGSGLQYSYRPSDSVFRTVYLYARSKQAGGTGKLAVSVDSGAAVNTSVVSSNSWMWYPVTLSGINTPQAHTIKIVPSSAQIEIDKIQISEAAP